MSSKLLIYTGNVHKIFLYEVSVSYCVSLSFIQQVNVLRFSMICMQFHKQLKQQKNINEGVRMCKTIPDELIWKVILSLMFDFTLLLEFVIIYNIFYTNDFN